jgi:hypothetical protein
MNIPNENVNENENENGDKICALISKWRSEALVRAEEHHRMRRMCRLIQWIYGAFSSLTAAGVSVTQLILSQIQDQGKNCYWILIFLAILTGLLAFVLAMEHCSQFDFGQFCERHKTSQSRYVAFARFVDQMLAQHHKIYPIDLIRKRLEAILHDAPWIKINPAKILETDIGCPILRIECVDQTVTDSECYAAISAMSSYSHGSAGNSPFTGSSRSGHSDRTPERNDEWR